MSFSNPETAGLASGASLPTTLLPLTPAGATSLPANVSNASVGPIDVSAFQAVLFVIAPSGGSGVSGTIVTPNWTDSGANAVFPAATGATPTTAISPTLGPGPMSVVYRNFGPYLTFKISPIGTPTGGTVQVFGINVPPRFDGPYTPVTSGTVLGNSDSLAVGGTIVLFPYTGPAFMFSSNTSGLLNNVQFQDAAGNWHNIGVDPSSNVQQPHPLWLPPFPCRIINNAASALPSVAMIAA